MNPGLGVLWGIVSLSPALNAHAESDYAADLNPTKSLWDTVYGDAGSLTIPAHGVNNAQLSIGMSPTDVKPRWGRGQR